MLTIYGVSIILRFIKIQYGSRNFCVLLCHVTLLLFSTFFLSYHACDFLLFSYVTACDLITIFYAAFFYVTSVTSLTKNAPGGDLIRVDLIRFPGSIPGDI